MHQTVKLATVGSIGDLGHIAKALGDADFNIEAIGGAEAQGLREDDRGVGIITLLVDRDEDSNLPELEDVLKGLTLDGGRKLINPQIIQSLDVLFSHDPGALAVAATALGEAGINIESILVIGVRGHRAVVSMAFRPDDFDTAKATLGGLGPDVRVLPKHGGKKFRENQHDDEDEDPGHPEHDH